MSFVSVEIRRNTSSTPWTYSALDLRQREIASQVRDGGTGRLLLSELAPVITKGRRTPETDLLVDTSSFKAQDTRLHSATSSTEVFTTDRGGLATYHGPGQWVLFPVDRLETLTGDSRGVRKVVCSLLEVALEVGRRFDPSAHIRSGAEMGVWTDRGKFAAVGIHIEKGILLHGLAVNGFKTPTSFVGLRPCGLDAPVDFLLKSHQDDEFLALGQMLALSTLRKLWN